MLFVNDVLMYSSMYNFSKWSDTLKILQHILPYFDSTYDHFKALCSKGLKSFIKRILFSSTKLLKFQKLHQNFNRIYFDLSNHFDWFICLSDLQTARITVCLPYSLCLCLSVCMSLSVFLFQCVCVGMSECLFVYLHLLCLLMFLSFHL